MALTACAFPSAAAAADGGGATAPTGPRSDAGGSSYEQGYAQSEQRRRAATRERRKRLAAQERQRKAAVKRRQAAARERQRLAVRQQRSAALDGRHRFPVAGPYTLGGEDGMFGAKRPGHRHEGQDISAASGTPVVAPWAGVVEQARYQRGGAGHYVVLDGDDEDIDYVFMHLRRGSTLVEPGQHVGTGEQIAEVGSTGRSSGAHLHFEVWVGGWYAKGGTPVDPLPLLQAWAT